MKIRKPLLIAFTLSLLLTTGCTLASKDNISKKDANTESVSPSSEIVVIDEDTSNCTTPRDTQLTLSDLDITYKDITINHTVPFSEIAEKLNIPINEVTDDIDLISAGSYDKGMYVWYIAHYPSKSNEDMTIEYVWSDEFDEPRICSVEFFNIETNRGVKIGDSFKALTDAYGGASYSFDNSNGLMAYVYKLNPDSQLGDEEITFLIDTNEDKVKYIDINYARNEIMELLDIPSFD